IVAAAENMPDAMAQRPGDVVTAMNGKTIEVLNTDAEGRLTLADAVFYAGKKKPDYIIDAATLTGACLVALGERISGIMGNDPDLVSALIHAGKKTGEKIWELPLADDYKDELKSPIADLKNIGGNWGGTINGGLFIQEFVGNNKWAHIDIAGPSWTDKPREYESRGGTGVMVRTFYEFLSKI
ncbi:MAG: aminopeptidase, partial [Deltaproteobacteria bacterium]|nr:aminopeptidase [Deltaproteobacteria bacterium]